MPKDLRAFIEVLEERYPGEVIRIQAPVDPVYELAAVRIWSANAELDSLAI